MRTFHIGGTASTSSEDNEVTFKHPIIITSVEGSYVIRETDGIKVFSRKGFINYDVVVLEIEEGSYGKLLVKDGDAIAKGTPLYTAKGRPEETVLSSENGIVKILDDKVLIVGKDQKAVIKPGSELEKYVEINNYIPSGKPIAYYDPFSEPFICEFRGYIHFVDIAGGSTMIEEKNFETGNIQRRITEHKLEHLQPRILVTTEPDGEGEVLINYQLPGGTYLTCEDNQEIHVGEIIAKIIKSGAKTADITGGLPRVGELFEARKPKNISVLAKVSGVVEVGNVSKGKIVVRVVDSYGESFKHVVPMNKHLLVRDGDTVEAGERLCDGAIDPHDILNIKGENDLQSFLVDEVQSVYRMQGVDINDKHLGVIVRQMLKKVEVVTSGDTDLVQGQQVDKQRFHSENERVVKEGGQPAVAKPLLLGITRAALSIESFLSAASFQETTKVLTESAIAGKTDELRGLKENVVIGHLIPAGTGMRRYRKVKLDNEKLLLNAHDAGQQEVAQRRENMAAEMGIEKNGNFRK